VWIAKISGITNNDTASSVDVSSYFAIGAIIEDINIDEIRSVSKFDARRIFTNIEKCTTIAEIVPSSLDDIFETLDICQPNTIQVNGDFFNDVNNLIAVQSIATIPIIGSISLDIETYESNILDPDPVKAAQTLDPYVQIISVNAPLGQSWGSKEAKTKLIEIIANIQEVISKPLVIGGGLTIANIGEIISEVKPNAVDVSSGVEKHSGIKNPELMQEFLQEVYDHKDLLPGV
jgi:phosphoribosylanthranilate isomerase